MKIFNYIMDLRFNNVYTHKEFLSIHKELYLLGAL